MPYSEYSAWYGDETSSATEKGQLADDSTNFDAPTPNFTPQDGVLEVLDVFPSELESKEEMQPEKSRRILGLAKTAGVLALGAAALTSWGFEIGPWNETWRIKLGTEEFLRTFSEFRTAWAVGAFTLGIEVLSSSLVIAGLNTKRMPGAKLVKNISSKLAAGENDKEPAERTGTDRGEDFALAMGLGAAVAAAKRHMTEPDIKPSEEVLSATANSAGVAVSSAAIAFLMTGGVKYAEDIQQGIDKFGDAALRPIPEALNIPAQPITDKIDVVAWSEWFVRNGTDQKLWLGIFGAFWVKKNSGIIAEYLRCKFKRNEAEDSEFVETTANETQVS